MTLLCIAVPRNDQSLLDAAREIMREFADAGDMSCVTEGQMIKLLGEQDPSVRFSDFKSAVAKASGLRLETFV